jgi:S-adenosylmethionine:tRNA ribosyltransferase-isomerase
VNIFIYPPYKFKFIDALITNFHLPKSTLFMMIAALVGSPQNLPPKKSLKIIKKIYRQAIDKKYKFYSYGDAMLIL